jgi:hypothetical protein
MKFLFSFFVVIAVGAFTAQASASLLFYDKCDDSQASLNGQARVFVVDLGSGFAGMSCQDLKSTFEAAQIVGMTLLPVSVALKTPGVREEIAGELATLGLTLANPAVLGVTVLGSVGIVTIYFVMKASIKDCEAREREQLKQELLEELQKSYSGAAGSNIPFNMQEDGGT